MPGVNSGWSVTKGDNMEQVISHLGELERIEIGMRAFNLMYYVTHPEVFEKIKNQKIEIVEVKVNEIPPQRM